MAIEVDVSPPKLPEIILTNFDSTKDEVGREEGMTWNQLKEKLSRPVVSDNKETVGMFNLTQFWRETATQHREWDGGVARANANCKLTTGIILDYDNGVWTIDKWMERYGGLSHIGYSSYNHIVKGPEKFRIVLRLNRPVYFIEWSKHATDMLEKFFPGTDATCFQPNRPFYLPGFAPKNRQLFRCWNSDGAVFNWDKIPKEKKEVVIAKLNAKAAKAQAYEKDGAYIWETFDIVQHATDHGLNVKKKGSSHECDCIRGNEHSDGSIRGAGVKGSVFNCFHSHQLTTTDYLHHFAGLEGWDSFRPYVEVREDGIIEKKKGIKEWFPDALSSGKK